MPRMEKVMFLVSCLAVVAFAQDSGAENSVGSTRTADAPAADDSGANPQTRFLFGLNPFQSSCDRCFRGDEREDSRCCASGHRQCCAQGFGGFPQQGFVQPGFPQQGFIQPGFGQQGFVQPGFGHQGFVQPGFPQQGFVQPGFGPVPQPVFNNFQGGAKAGFCRRRGLFDGLFTRSGAGGPQSGPGLRSAVADDEQEGRSKRRARQVTFPGQEESSGSSAEAGSGAQTRSAQGDNPANPNTRFFLPNPFGPGSLLPDPFCRDECFNDFDCPGNLKCCLRECRKCENPSFF